MRVMYERVAGIDVHKDMVKVCVRTPGATPFDRVTEILEYRTFYGVLQRLAADLVARGVSHVAMEASGIYSDPVYEVMAGQGFTEVILVNPEHVKALRGHKTDAIDARRLAEFYECGLLRGSYVPPRELRELRDLTRYRIKLVQARSSEKQRLQKALESGGIKLDSVASDVTGISGRDMIEALIDGERRGVVLADLARGRMRTTQKLADLSQALVGHFTEHHAMLCRLHLDRIVALDADIAALEQAITAKAAPYRRQVELLCTIPGIGVIAACTWIGEIGPQPHLFFDHPDKLAKWAGLAPGNEMSAGKRKQARTGFGGTYIKPILVTCAWSAVRVPGRLQAQFNRLVRRLGGRKNTGAAKKAIVAIAHDMLKIGYRVLERDQPYVDLGADFYTSRTSPEAMRDYHLRKLQQSLPEGTVVTITPAVTGGAA